MADKTLPTDPADLLLLLLGQALSGGSHPLNPEDPPPWRHHAHLLELLRRRVTRLVAAIRIVELGPQGGADPGMAQSLLSHANYLLPLIDRIERLPCVPIDPDGRLRRAAERALPHVREQLLARLEAFPDEPRADYAALKDELEALYLLSRIHMIAGGWGENSAWEEELEG